MIELPNKIEKSYIADKPRVVFDGIIEEIDTEEKAQKAIETLSKETVVGFDTETRPSFIRGVAHKIALLQLSTNTNAYLFRLNKMGIPDCVVDFLSNPNIIKVGISIKDDFHSMSSRRKFNAAGFVELQDLCGEMGIEEKGLQKMYCLLFNERISKNQQLSNWEIDSLTESQRQYAAIDAWACLRIFHYISELKQTGEYRIIRKYAEECNTEER
ncbi:MAG: 3'-5' exonuclease domain-containing protein 2 [Bacteroidaceae bacterium]|nr:3'-5' exonuclease domain-containing protein 2 [Bacteroidaceae bacterium]